MTTLRAFAARVKAFVSGGRADDAALDADVQAHLEQLADDYISKGLAPDRAREAARRDFGGVQQMKESYRDQRSLPMLEHVAQDLRSAWRSFRRTPGLTMVALVTIALGIFGPTVTFTMAKAWILEPLPFPRPADLVDLRSLDKRSGSFASVNVADFLDWRRASQSFESLAGYRWWDVRLTGSREAEFVRGAMVTPDFFTTLGVDAHLGRLFDPRASESDQAGLVVISPAMWRDRFRGEPSAIGRTIQLNGEAYTIVGVLPDGFQFTLLGRVDVWRTLTFTPAQSADRRAGFLVGLGRLRHGKSVEDGRQELIKLSERLATAYPDTNAWRGVRVLGLADEIRLHHDMGFIVPVMFAMVCCVLFIACVNVTNVMLARTSARRQELAVRLALGASRTRIIRQWLVEHVVLFVIASAGGAWLAVYGADWITQSIPVMNRQYLRNYAVLPVDRGVVLFALASGAVCGLIFGGLTASAGARVDVNADLRDASTRATSGRPGTRLRSTLVVCEVALALAVLIGTGLLVLTARNIMRVDLGFDARNLLAFDLQLDEHRYGSAGEIRGFYDRLTRNLADRPEVDSVAAGSLVPFAGNGNSVELFPEGAPDTPPAETPSVSLSQVTADYAAAVRLHLVRGRLLSAADGAETPRAALVNDTFVSRQFHGEDPIGRRFRLGRGTTDLWTIVGVVADVKNFESTDPPELQVYVPFEQLPTRAMTVVVRTTGRVEALAAVARSAVAAIDPSEPVVDLTSMDERIHRITGPYQTIASFVMFLSAVTLLLAGVGVYGVISYSWALRTREIGIRIALGASRADVGALVLKQIRTFMMAALVPGLALAWWLGQAFKAMLFGVTPTDWRLYLAMTALLVVVALLAVAVPVRRAMSVDPMKALHYE